MKEYDLVFGVGEACSCTQVLRKSNLQFYSYPFDWLYGCSFENRIKILADEFKDFINKEDLEYSYEERSYSCDAYYNKVNQITFNHDFLKGMPFEQAYEMVKEKYDRRINRLFEQIESANSILIVCVEAPTTNHENKDKDTIIKGFDIIKSKYPDKKIDLFYIRNVFDSESMKVENLSENITLYELYYKKIDEKFDYIVDMRKLRPIFKNIKLKNADCKVFKRNINKIWINLIPIKSLRQKLRKQYHV